LSQRETKRLRSIVELEHAIRQRLQRVIVDSFRRRLAATCRSRHAINATQTHHCPPPIHVGAKRRDGECDTEASATRL